MTSTTCLPAELCSLSNELVLLIAENFDSASDLLALLIANRWLSQLLTPLLHKHALKDRGIYSALQWATQRNHLCLVKLLLAKGADPKYVTKGCGTPPIHFAIPFNNLPMMTLLLDHGADANQRNQTFFESQTPLDCAASCRKSAMVELLLKSGADPGLVDRSQSTALYKAIVYGADDEMIDMLCKWGAPVDDTLSYNPLHAAIRFHHFGAVKILLQHGVNVHILDLSGRTAIEHAASWGIRVVGDCPIFVAMVAMLMDEGAFVPPHLILDKGHDERSSRGSDGSEDEEDYEDNESEDEYDDPEDSSYLNDDGDYTFLEKVRLRRFMRQVLAWRTGHK